MMDGKVFRQNMCYLREERRLTQEELAERAGVSARHISKIETGTSEPKLKMIYKIAHGLEIEPMYLLDPQLPTLNVYFKPLNPLEITTREQAEQALRTCSAYDLGIYPDNPYEQNSLSLHVDAICLYLDQFSDPIQLYLLAILRLAGDCLRQCKSSVPQKVEYRLSKDSYKSEDMNESYQSYGVEAFLLTSKGHAAVDTISDISTAKDYVSEVVDKLNRNKVSIDHFHDVVTDFLAT